MKIVILYDQIVRANEIQETIIESHLFIIAGQNLFVCQLCKN